MSVILVLVTSELKDLKLETSLSSIVRLCLKKKKNRRLIKERLIFKLIYSKIN